MKVMKLGDLLIGEKIISQDQLNTALKLQAGTSRRLGDILLRMNVVDDTKLISTLSKQLDIAFNKTPTIEDNVKKLLPKWLCKKYCLIPIKQEAHNTIIILMHNPLDEEAKSIVEVYTGKVVLPNVSTKDDIYSLIDFNIPFSYKDIFNEHYAPFFYKTIICILVMAIISVSGFYGKMVHTNKFGTEISNELGITYKNHDLTLEILNDGTYTLMGTGVHSSGSFLVHFKDKSNLLSFLEAKKKTLSEEQLQYIMSKIQ